MSRAGLRALRIGTFSTLVRPRALACLALISLTAFILLGFGLTHGSLPIPTSAIASAASRDAADAPACPCAWPWSWS